MRQTLSEDFCLPEEKEERAIQTGTGSYREAGDVWSDWIKGTQSYGGLPSPPRRGWVFPKVRAWLLQQPHYEQRLLSSAHVSLTEFQTHRVSAGYPFPV